VLGKLVLELSLLHEKCFVDALMDCHQELRPELTHSQKRWGWLPNLGVCHKDFATWSALIQFIDALFFFARSGYPALH
jgi:hypothetical protein